MFLQITAFIKYSVIYSDFYQSFYEHTDLTFRYKDGEITHADERRLNLLFITKWLQFWYIPTILNWYFRNETFCTRQFLVFAQILSVMAFAFYEMTFGVHHLPMMVINGIGGVYWIKVMCVWAQEKRGLATNYATDIHEIDYND